MKTNIQKTLFMLALLFSGALFQACEKEDLAHKQHPEAVHQFLNTVKADPVMLEGGKLGDSWRLIREKASYKDGEYTKTYDLNLLTDPETANYKEYWTFDREKVLLTFAGTRYGKSWDGYYLIFDQELDLENKRLTIDYVLDGGAKTYTRYWTVTSLTDTELILTDESQQEEYFYQYTFRREKF